MAKSHVQVGTSEVVEIPQAKKMSKWWPLSFLMLWIAFTGLGAGLVGGSIKMMDYTCTDYTETDCTYNLGGGMFYGGVACCVIAGIFSLAFWIVLAIFVIRRSRARRAQVIYINNQQQQPQPQLQTPPQLQQWLQPQTYTTYTPQQTPAQMA